ncbi:MAG: DUF502 domain-containing protein [Planctomycetales bacterium]|nr:DUF502 domain-containing protein [Planctomycetales bacterium]NIM07786.1 DUF502 domain-containing protein [Planctomycetales bacterium]NIN07280.1 DUF502 domain-containing protein [Planctomycetales bacterium]NIN76372.1 DUF502 domain-containing protein [Planctomycetales bacterium]NIO33581.1 DUF502 domain-containing protein [Planctomycetales bacterium]
MPSKNSPATAQATRRQHSFRRAVLSGFAVVLPPLLTIVIFLWIGTTINAYVLRPAKSITFWVAQKMGELGWFEVRLEGVQEFVDSWQFLVIFVGLFIIVMFFLGRFLAAGAGRFAHANFERLIHRLPLIRNVYGSVKQVTDFVFSESEVEYTRVVALEYPRKGIWSLGLVTGESMLDIRSAANEPVLSVLVPTSPAPFTGFTVTIKKSEAIDLNLTIDQAFQFIVSCGVVVPVQQQQEHLKSLNVPQQLETMVGDDLAPPGPADGDSALPASGA